MNKIQYLRKFYRIKGKKKNQLLFVKPCKDGLILNIFISDPDFESQPDENYLDASNVVFSSKIELSSPKSSRLLKVLGGISGVTTHLEKQANWRFDRANQTFYIMYKEKEFAMYDASQSQLLNIGSIEEATQMLKQNEKQFKDYELKYLLGLVFRAQRKEQLLSKSQVEQRRRLTKQKVEQEQMERMKKAQVQIIKQQQLKLKEKQKEETKKVESVEDIVRAKQKVLNFIRTTSYGIEAFQFEGMTIIKNSSAEHEKKERNIFGSTSLFYKNHFTVRVQRIAKENRNPVIWIGIADANEEKLEKKEVMQHVICMSDRRKIYQNGKYNFKDSAGNTLSKDFVQGDIVHVKIDYNQGDKSKPAKITWENERGEIYGSCESAEVKDKSIMWVPFIELWKTDDAIVWME